jgi:hypothetical protein
MKHFDHPVLRSFWFLKAWGWDSVIIRVNVSFEKSQTTVCNVDGVWNATCGRSVHQDQHTYLALGTGSFSTFSFYHSPISSHSKSALNADWSILSPKYRDLFLLLSIHTLWADFRWRRHHWPVTFTMLTFLDRQLMNTLNRYREAHLVSCLTKARRMQHTALARKSFALRGISSKLQTHGRVPTNSRAPVTTL